MTPLILLFSLVAYVTTCKAYNYNVTYAIGTFNKYQVGGVISKPVFEEYFITKTSKGRTVIPEEATAVFNLMDVSSDQVLDQREFVIGYTLWKEFRSHDKDNNGCLTPELLVKLFDSNHKNLIVGEITFVEYLHRIITNYQLQ
ncbi:hypothetical protein LSTR_LSTR005601 [Laodelphax striatellus]|uniref:EF-hand domain-containing protein n=1 Tax=Laodelphax striatellus TaxID=195883 RepID=A0A482WYX3_LAOST|nr:hypothetical protein LSTR_LSTR005601 [Laodelphax striatellus]